MKNFIVTYLLLLVTVLALVTGCEKNPSNNNPPDEGQFKIVKSQDVVNQSIKCLVVDESGKKWMSSDSGLYMFDNKNWYQFTGSHLPGINSMVMHNGQLMIATDSGAYTLEPDFDIAGIVDTLSIGQPGGTFQPISVCNIGMGQRLWLGVPDGLAMYDNTKWRLNRTISNNLVSITNVQSMAFRKQDAFFGTFGNYLYHVRYNAQTDAISGASQMLGGADNPHYNYNGELTTDTIFCLFAASDSSILFGSVKGLTRNKGETKVDNGIFEYYLKGERVHCVAEFANHALWAGTENGLYLFKNNNWSHFTTSDGLASNKINCLAEDKDGSVWIGTPKGLSQCVGNTFVKLK
jgi:ligand-binding sensor domain-containing protein